MHYFHAELRGELFDEIHVSPHMDDSAYSCAGRILQERRAGKRVLVVTVFGDGRPEPAGAQGELPPGPARAGSFGDYQTRQAEERAVMRYLDTDYIWLNYPELLFRKHGLSDLWRFAFPFTRLGGRAHDDLFEILLALLTRHLAPGGSAFFPFAIGFHPDHRVLFDVGRALHALGRFRLSFYEDVPYAGVPALRALRLRALDMPAALPLLRGAGDLNLFLFRSLGRLVRALTFLPVLLYLIGLVCLRGLSGALDKLRDEPSPSPHAQDISDTIVQKAEAMRLYPTQTAFFLTLGPELVELIQFEGRAEERSWRFPPFPAPLARLSARQRAALSRLDAAASS